MERIGCSQQETCRLRNTKLGCREDVDHLYFPRHDYTTPLEKRFRILDENKRQICRALHEERHATEEPPLKPSIEVMRAAVEQAKIARSLQGEAYDSTL